MGILALENQNQVDYTMPYRCMQYDTLEYGRQLSELRQLNRDKNCLNTSAEHLCGIRKSDRLAPVYTICLYHGEDPWDGPLSLRDMMNFSEDTDGMNNFLTDYPKDEQRNHQGIIHPVGCTPIVERKGKIHEH